MYHAPVPLEAEPFVNGPAEDSADPSTLETGSERLKEAHLQYAQVKGRAMFAPYFAISAVGAAGLAAWSMFQTVRVEALIGWFALIVFANWVSCRRAMEAASWGVSRTARVTTRWLPVAEAAGLAGLWCSLPAYVFLDQPPHAQVVIAGAMVAMIITAIGLSAVPVAAFAWVGTFTLAFSLTYIMTSGALGLQMAAAFFLVASVAAVGVARLTSWVSGRLEALAKTRAQAESIRLLLKEYEQRGVGWLWQVDGENRVVYISSRMTSLLGRSTNQLIGHSLPAALGGNSALGQALLAREPFGNLEMELKTRRGARWISLSGDPIIDMAGHFQGFRGVGQDITDVRKTQERLTNLANMDVLSGLPNRGRVRQLLGEALTGATTTNVPCAVMFLDLDGFKPVNDTFGHPKGDAVLKSVSQRLVKEVGQFGHVGRMGGDEFAVVIRDAQSRRLVESLAERVIGAIAEPFHIDKAEIRIGVSVGCAFGPLDGQSVDDLIQKADLALYQAKAQGRGTVCFFNADMQNEAEDRLRLEQEMKTGIAAGHFRLLYQPLINAVDQTLMGFEALVRWQHPTRGFVSPAEFIPLAEETGLIMELGEWVVHEACRAAATWPEHITVAVNVSAKQLIYPALPNTIVDALSRHKLPANRLELEVTESVFMGDSVNALDVLKRLRAVGVGIALDDFGTGYSSLGYLNKAVFHKLKIDGSFVREAGHDKETVAIIQSIVQLAKNFRMMVTAEGVETVDDFNRMKGLGVNQIQGYLFGRPMPYDKASELVHGLQVRKSA